MKAVKTISLGQAEVVDGVPIPSVASNPGYALVKTSYVGVTHSDYLFTDLEFLFQKNITVGSEFSGEIVEVGEGCTRFSKGDKIAGCCFVGGAATPHAGAQAEYILVRGDAMFSVDAFGDAVGMDQAAGLGVAFSTVYHGLYYLLGLPLPGSQEATSDDAQVRRTVLIYGGTTNTGMIAIQYAKLSGYKVITTCSTRNFDYVRSLGADEAYDYHDTERCIEEIRGSVGDDLHYVLDCVGAFESRRISAAVMAKGGVFGAVSPWDFPRADVTSHFVRGNMVLGEDFLFSGQTVPANMEIFHGWKEFVKLSEGLLCDEKIQLPKIKLIKSLESIPQAWQDLRDWKLSATKLICEVQANN